jgi:hypothetical protein
LCGAKIRNSEYGNPSYYYGHMVDISCVLGQLKRAMMYSSSLNHEE